MRLYARVRAGRSPLPRKSLPNESLAASCGVRRSPMKPREFVVERVPVNSCSEVIGGVWHPIPLESMTHQKVCSAIEAELRSYLSCSLEQVFTRAERRPLCAPDSTLYPDFWVSTLSTNPAKERRVAYPGLVIEVLSASREWVDRGAKLRAYRAIGSVREIILIDPIQRFSEQYLRLDDSSWRFKEISSGNEIFLESIGGSIRPV